MAEITFATISQYGMTVSPITGAVGALGTLYVKGTQFKSGATPKREVVYNFENKLMYNNVDHGSRRGINLTIFEEDMRQVYCVSFDVYTDDGARNNLADKMRALTKTQIGVLTSYDAIQSNAKLDDAFKYLHSTSWPKTTFLTSGYRSSYCAIICGKKQNIVAEKFVGNNAPEPDALIEMAFNKPTAIGHYGYGTPLISDENIYEPIGTTAWIKRWFDKTPLSTLSLKPGDGLLLQSLGEIDAIASGAKNSVVLSIAYHTSTGGLIRETRKVVQSVEGWDQFEIRDTIPANTVSISVDAKREVASGGSLSGHCFVKNTTLSLADHQQDLPPHVSIGVYGTSVKAYEDSLGNFGHYDPTGYYKAYDSESNLLRGQNIEQSANESVKWFNRVLDKPNERVVMKGTGNIEKATMTVNLDPRKPYYACVWVNKHQKAKGQYMLGLRSYNSANAQLDLMSTDRSDTNKWKYAQRPPFDTLEDRQWYLLQGFILPNHIPTEKAIEFIEENKEFYGWDDLYGNGIGLSDEGDGNYGWINHKDCAKGKLAFLDWYNDTTEAKSIWALPILREMKVGSVDIDDVMLTSISVSG